MLIPDKQMAAAIKNKKASKKDLDFLWNDFRKWLAQPLGTFSNYHHRESIQALVDNYAYEFPVEVVNYQIAKKQMLVDEFVYEKFISNEKIKNDYKYYLGIHNRLRGIDLVKKDEDNSVSEITVNANLSQNSGVQPESKLKKSKETTLELF
jgi:hypothetical protein